MDGDGDREVVLGGKVEPGIAKQPLILEVLDGRGRPAPPLFLGRVLGRDFPGFDRNFQTVFQSAGGGRFAAYIHHYWFYPTYAFLWDASLGRVVFNVSHSGRFYRAFPFHGGAAFEGFNNRLLHQRVLLVTGPLDGSPTGAQIVDDVNQFAFRNLRAYHLLGDGDAVLFDGPDRVRVRLSEGGERTVTPEGDIEGAPGSGAESLALLMEYRRIRDLLLQGDGAAARPRAGLARERAVLAGLAGHGALFAALEAEADAVAGDFRRASETARERAGHFPGCDQDLLIKAALYALIDGDALRAGELLEGVSAEGLGSRRDEVRTLVVWAALLRSPREGRATLHLQQTLLGSGPYWGPYMAFQEGWAALLEGDAAAARAVLAPALRAEGMEHHAAGHFLALIAEGAFDAEAFDAYLASAGVHPAYLEWVGAVGKGEAKAAERHRALLEADAVHAPDSALMLALMNRVPTVYPVLR